MPCKSLGACIPGLTENIVRSWEPPGVHKTSYTTGGILLDAYAITLAQFIVIDCYASHLLTIEGWKRYAQENLYVSEDRNIIILAPCLQILPPRYNILMPEGLRLNPLDDSWERVNLEDLGRELTGGDPEICDFRNNLTGEIMDSDPRYLPEALRDWGVQLEEFILV
jgi:hypothetical protein